MRVEIIANHSVQEDILHAVKKTGVGSCYTIVPAVQGVGSSNPRLGDPIWPEENFMLIIYCETHEAIRLAAAVAEVKSRFQGEGIKVFAVEETKELV